MDAEGSIMGYNQVLFGKNSFGPGAGILYHHQTHLLFFRGKPEETSLFINQWEFGTSMDE